MANKKARYGEELLSIQPNNPTVRGRVNKKRTLGGGQISTTTKIRGLKPFTNQLGNQNKTISNLIKNKNGKR